MGIAMDELRLVDSIRDALKRRPIVVRQIRTVFQDSDPSRLRLVEMPMVRVVAIHIGRTDDGMLDRADGGKRRATVFVGEKPDPRPCNNQESGDNNCNGAYSLPQTALIKLITASAMIISPDNGSAAALLSMLHPG